MRAARVTYSGAYHHIMGRGVDGKNIFPNDELKRYFLEIIREKSMQLKIRIFAYCLMDNHYHLILQNSSGMLAGFIGQLNGQYGKRGGMGYVFQGRYKSTLIQEYPYLSVSILSSSKGGIG
ncbi:MAG TPA: transposase [Spirochaetota bacterium]|nr:transposase [Spirochaetota bacterium]